MGSDSDLVIVAGAALAGLCAARSLQAEGVAVAVLEAADRVGGRVGTDVVAGFQLDRGFQVHNTACPEAARMLDHDALDLRAFTPGALIRRRGRLHRVADPRRQPLAAPATLRAGLGTAGDKLRTARIALAAAALPAGRLRSRPETTTAAALRARGLSPTIIDAFFRPFLSGVFLESELSTSSRFFDLALRCFARGRLGVPAGGMRAIQSPLPEATLLLDGDGTGPVTTTIVLTEAAPSYSPDHRALISSSVVGPPVAEPAVRRQLAQLYGVDTAGWTHLATYRLDAALPAMPPPHDFRRPVRVSTGVYVCGDHRDSSSIQGAMVSGRRAVAAVRVDLGLAAR